MNRPPPYSKKKLDIAREQLEQVFALGQGMLVGSSAVVSRKAHLEPREQPGMVHILLGKDAGETYLTPSEYEKFVHIDVFHQPAEINIADLAGRIRNAIHRFLAVINPDLQTPPEEQEVVALNLAQRIRLVTGAGEGTVFEPLQQVYPPPARRNSQVHILAKLPPKYYALVFCIVAETAKTLAYQGVKLRPVRQIIHIHTKKSYKSGDL